MSSVTVIHILSVACSNEMTKNKVNVNEVSTYDFVKFIPVVTNALTVQEMRSSISSLNLPICTYSVQLYMMWISEATKANINAALKGI
jgi:hypothetical protein